MQAFQITYSPDDTRVALGWPDGLVEVATVNPSDGSPGERLVAIFAHTREIVWLGFVGDRLVSVDDKGGVVVSALPSGEILHRASIGGEYVAAGVSPGGRTLFLFAYRGERDSNTFAIDLSTYRMTYGPDVDALTTKARVFGLDDRRAAYYFLQEVDGVDGDALAIVDFDSGDITIRRMPGAVKDKIGDLPPFAIDVASGVGVRIGYGHPLEIMKLDGKEYLALQLELFDPVTLAARGTVRAMGVDADKKILKAIRKGDLDAEAHVEKRNELAERITSMAIAAGGRYVFIGAKGGGVRRIPLDGSKAGAWIVHGRFDEPGGNTLDDLFARNVRNNQTLGVSASGRFVGFGNPNDFFCAETVAYASALHIRLPRRALAGITEPPRFVGQVRDGAELVLGLSGEAGNLMVVDLAASAVGLAIGVPYGSELRGASRSPDGDELVLAYAGRNSVRVRSGGTDIVDLPLPPHTVFAGHLADGRTVMAHHSGAVIVMDGNRLHAFRSDGDADGDGGDDDDDDADEDFEREDADFDERGDGDGDDEDEAEGGDEETGVDWQLNNPDGVEPLMLVGNAEGVFVYNDYFEQRDDVYDVAHARVDGVDLVLVLNEGGTLDTYRIGDDRIHHVSQVDCVDGRTVAAAGAYATVHKTDPGRVEVFRLSAAGPESVLAFDLPGVRLAAPALDGTIVVFDQETGIVSSLDPSDRRERAHLAYRGPAPHTVGFDPRSGRMVLVESTGAILVIDPRKGVSERVLRIVAEGDDRRIDLAAAPVGRLEPRDHAIERGFPDAATLASRAADRARKDALFDHDHEPADPAERDLGKRIDKLLAAVRKLPEHTDAKCAAMVTELVGPYEAATYEAAAGGDRRKDIGRCFAIRGCAQLELGLIAEARADFQRCLVFRYWPAYQDLISLETYQRADHAAAIRIADELLVSRNVKEAIGLRKSLPVYRALLHALVMAGDAARARFVAQQVVENLLPFLKDEEEEEEGDDEADDDDAKPSKKKKAKKTKNKTKAPVSDAASRIRILSSVLDDLRAITGPHAGLATEIAGGIDAMLASYPPTLPDAVQATAALEAVKATAIFFAKNDRLTEVPPRLDGVLGPHERSRYHTVALSGGEKHKLGDLFGLRGKARLAAGDAPGAAADFEKAIEFREVCHYVDAIDLYLGPLARPDDAARLVEHCVTCPFNWSSEYYTPLSELDYAYALAARAVIGRVRGSNGSVILLRRLYPGQLAAVADRLQRAIVAPGHQAAPAAAAVIAELARPA